MLLVIALVFPRELLGRLTGKFVFQLCGRDHKGFSTETVRLTEDSSEVICWETTTFSLCGRSVRGGGLLVWLEQEASFSGGPRYRC